MTDITERLRNYEGEKFQTTVCYNGLRDEAADEIDRLRAELDVANNAHRDYTNRLAAAYVQGMEDAAWVADNVGDSYRMDETGWLKCSETIAKAIRALAEQSPSPWWPISEAPKDGRWIMLAKFAPGTSVPKYVALAQWDSALPSYTQCATFSGWFVSPPMISDPTRFKGGRCEYGTIYGEDAPTHFMLLPEPPQGDA